MNSVKGLEENRPSREKMGHVPLNLGLFGGVTSFPCKPCQDSYVFFSKSKRSISIRKNVVYRNVTPKSNPITT